MTPSAAMPFMMQPIANSRTPKCRLRPNSLPLNAFDEADSGRKDGSPFMRVLFEPARSAEPPHSSGSTEAMAQSTWPDAERVATALPSSKTGSAASQPSGSFPAWRRSSRAAPSGLAALHASKRSSQSRRNAAARSAARARTAATASSSTANMASGSAPRASFRPDRASAPSFAPWMPPVFCLPGVGQPMMVRTAMIDGLSVTALAALMAADRASTSSL